MSHPCLQVSKRTRQPWQATRHPRVEEERRQEENKKGKGMVGIQPRGLIRIEWRWHISQQMHSEKCTDELLCSGFPIKIVLLTHMYTICVKDMWDLRYGHGMWVHIYCVFQKTYNLNFLLFIQYKINIRPYSTRLHLYIVVDKYCVHICMQCTCDVLLSIWVITHFHMQCIAHCMYIYYI